MRWVPFLLAVYAIMLLQTSLGRLLTFSTDFAGQIGPDLAAVLAVFLALHARAAVDALAGAWVLASASTFSPPEPSRAGRARA